MVLVVAEQRDGSLNRATWEVMAAAQAVGHPIRVAVLGSGLDAVATELAAGAVDAVVILDDPSLEFYTADGFIQALEGLIHAERPDLVMLPHTYQTRDFVPALATRLDRALVTDCTTVTQRDGALVFGRAMFHGKLTADVVATGPTPHIVSFQIGAFRAGCGGTRRGAGGAPSGVRADRRRCDPPEARAAVSGGQARGGSVAGRTDRRGGAWHQEPGAP